MNGLFRRFLTRRDGATAIEFALLALPFFLIVFASLETFLAFSAEQLFANANETMARRMERSVIRARSAFATGSRTTTPGSSSMEGS